MRAQWLPGISGPFGRRYIFRDPLQANRIPGEINQAISVADHFAKRTRHKSGARRQLRACRQAKADAVFQPMQPWPIRPEPTLFVDGKSSIPQGIDDMIEALSDSSAWCLR